MVNRIQLKDHFTTLRDNLSNVYSYDAFQLKDKSAHFFLYGEITKAHINSISLIKSIKAEPAEILFEINNWITLLKMNLEIRRESQNPIKNRLRGMMSDFIESLEEIKLTFPDYVKSSSNEDIKKTRKKHPVHDYNKPVIKQSQVLLLMHYLRKNSVLINDIDDSALSECFGTLTGYSIEQLRKKYVDFKKDDIKYKPAEIIELKELLIKVSKDISEHG